MEKSKLKEILEQHKLWVDGKGGICADLTRADLTGADLTGANLLGANLLRANLTRANLLRANLWRADLNGASLTKANLTGANLTGANLQYANLSNAILPEISWIIPGCLAHLNNIKYDFYLKKDNKLINFVQDNIGFFIQDNPTEGTFDMLVGDIIIRNIPDWVKYSGLKQIESESV